MTTLRSIGNAAGVDLAAEDDISMTAGDKAIVARDKVLFGPEDERGRGQAT